MDSQPARIQVNSPATLLAVVPHLLGFHPERSLVVLALAGPHARIITAFRFDLPDPPDPEMTVAIADHAAGLLRRQEATTAIAVGYGPGFLVTPVTDTLLVVLPRHGVRVRDLLRVDEGRYWSYLCRDLACCPPEGTPVPGSTHPAAVSLTAAGITALPDRAALAATIAPVTGPAADAMVKATRHAALALVTEIESAGQDAARVRGLDLVRDAITSYRAGQSIIDPVHLARLTVALINIEIRDDAWARMRPEHQPAHTRLWTDLTRHAQPGHVAAPASLLAFTAWQAGDGALANLALDRAMADDPGYSMAGLLRDALAAGAPPSAAVITMTPEEVAASYDAQRHHQQ